MTSNRDLVRAAGRTLDDLRTLHANFVGSLRRHGLLDYVTSMSGRGKMALPEALALEALMYRVRVNWETTRTAYAIHPEMTAELGEVDRDRVPSAVFGHLPHRNPLLVWPQPIPCRNLGERPGEIIAAYVMGIRLDNRAVCDTHDPQRDAIRIAIISRSGTRMEFSMVYLNLAEPWFSPEEEVRSAARRAAELDHQANRSAAHSVDEHLACARSKLMPVLDTLVYACSSDVDAVPAQACLPGKKQARKAAAPARAEQVINVGWRLGPQLGQARRRWAETAGAGAGGGRKAPHPRRATYGIRWSGKGKTEPRLTFIRPTFVNRDLLDADTAATVVPVRNPGP